MERRQRLVESQVTVKADAQHLQINTAIGHNKFFVISALGIQILCHAVRQMGAALINVHEVKNTPAHEIVI